jgi:hypothetical protein
VRRRLFNILAVLSLLVFVATVALWARSHWWEDLLFRQHRDVQGLHTISFHSGMGGLWFSKVEVLDQETTVSLPPLRGQLFGWDWHVAEASGPGVGFSWERRGFETTMQQRFISIPYWFPALIMAAVPAWWYRNRRAVRRSVDAALDPQAI